MPGLTAILNRFWFTSTLFIYLFIKARERQIDLQMFERLQWFVMNDWKEHKFYIKYVTKSQVKKLYSSFNLLLLLSSPFSGLSHSSEGFLAWRVSSWMGWRWWMQFNDMTQVRQICIFSSYISKHDLYEDKKIKLLHFESVVI